MGHLILPSVFIVFIVLAVNLVNGAGYSTELESELRTALYTNYEVLQRPSEKVDVSVTLSIITINSMDIKAQMLSTAGYFTLEWEDSRLAWSTNVSYSLVNFLFSNEEFTWRPAVIVENSVSEISVFSDENTLMRIDKSGMVSWSPGAIYQTSCDVDITYYPLDRQSCSISLSTWAYTSTEVDLTFASTIFDLSYYKENGEWEITATSSSSESGTRESQSFSRLHFTLDMRRRPLFHILNTLFPVVLMASLTVFVFKLPPESGERIGMSLTVLLAYAVYLTLIAENIPQISLSASILSTYLTIILIISCLSVIFTIVVLDVYFNRDEQEIPDWVQKVTGNFLVYVVCWKGNRLWKRRKQVSPSDDYEVKKPLDNSAKGPVVIPLQNGTQHKNTGIGNNTIEEVKVENEKADLKRQQSRTSSDCGPTQKLYKWKEIALIMDRCLMYIFMFMVLTSTLVCMALLIDHYMNA